MNTYTAKVQNELLSYILLLDNNMMRNVLNLTKPQVMASRYSLIRKLLNAIHTLLQ